MLFIGFWIEWIGLPGLYLDKKCRKEYTHTHRHTHVHAHISQTHQTHMYTDTHMHIRAYTHKYTEAHAHTYRHAHISFSICLSFSLCISIYIHIHSQLYIYIYIYTRDYMVGWLVGWNLRHISPCRLTHFYANNQFYFRQFSLAWILNLFLFNLFNLISYFHSGPESNCQKHLCFKLFRSVKQF